MKEHIYSLLRNKLPGYFAAVALLTIPVAGYGQAPNLGTAANFVIYTSNGAVLNTGITHLTGNVGTNVGSNTGFGNVNGVMLEADGATLLAAGDLQTAYTQITNTTNTGTLALLLGNGTTLNAGVYTIPGNASLNNTLILDGQGDSNALFIFKITGAFASASAAQVSLVNSAQACNVFWTTEDVVSLATNTNMKGTIIAHNAAINMGTGVNFVGRALSIAGAITIDGVTGHTPNGCGSTMLTGPIAPAMGAAGCFALFSANGPVSDDGQSMVTGNIGTNLGSVTAYDPLNVTGIIYPGPNTYTASAAGDLTTVANYLNALSPDIELLYPAQFGGGLVLTPHTYIMTQAAMLTDTVFLDAEGYTDAVFVIKINGALTTGTYAVVKLINGAQASNVYWKIDGLLNLNDYSDFAGTVIGDQAITLSMGSSIEGSALTAVGALSTATTTVTTIPGPCFPLSVSWVSFTGNIVQGNALLEWTTSGEINTSFFTLEKSNDGKSFQKVATVNGVGGSANQHYSYTDPQPAKYYRIAQTGTDGVMSYYRVVTLNAPGGSASDAIFYPNPFSGSLSVTVSGATATNTSELSIYDVVGTMVMKTVITQTITEIKTDLPAGVYYYQMTDQNQHRQSGKLVSAQ